ncbi:hypothetical protein FJT64_018611 [Amphibalanus amphitrite]|uniref:Uncharacterized protein n=1 Tax=Amphibalanus amphitrite TaxID=1232801 RepID=A0A6A4WTC6_AMPAM|nr:hypothetical protein FJT64_018611 [Amphibalanus amphitrite]
MHSFGTFFCSSWAVAGLHSRTVIRALPLSSGLIWCRSVTTPSLRQLYTYASIAGSVSPTSMALYTSPPRSAASSVVRMSTSAAAGGGGGAAGAGTGSGASRWNQHFILEENVDYGMMQSLLPAAGGADVPAGIIDDDRYFSSVVHTGDGIESTASSATATVVVPSPSSQPPGSPSAKSQP